MNGNKVNLYSVAVAFFLSVCSWGAYCGMDGLKNPRTNIAPPLSDNNGRLRVKALKMTHLKFDKRRDGPPADAKALQKSKKDLKIIHKAPSFSAENSLHSRFAFELFWTIH